MSSFVLMAAALGCGGGAATPGGSGPGMAGKGMAGAPGAGAAGAGGMTMPPGPMGGGGMMMKPPKMGMGGTGTIVIGVPTPGSPGTVFPGGGPSGSAPLAPGCTPASANECPTASGACATSATSNPTGTTTGSVCFYGPISTTTITIPAPLAATIEYLKETAGGQEYYRFRITFDPSFVDNTYGTNAIGWVQKGHTFKDLVGSDHAELSLFDATPALVSQFDIDYITASATGMCGYAALGVSGGEGKMLIGDSKYILASTTSLNRNLNGCGYCTSDACGGDCTVNSPATDAMYTPHPAAPRWDFRVVYEVWVDAAVFAGKGFGGASISFVHASPSKASSNTVTVTPRPCGGDGCPEGTRRSETSEGPKCVCPNGNVPIESSEGWKCDACPAGTQQSQTSEGPKCVCPNGNVPVQSSEGWKCDVCPEGTVSTTDSEGTPICVPIIE
jgi:hypothetical protein